MHGVNTIYFITDNFFFLGMRYTLQNNRLENQQNLTLQTNAPSYTIEQGTQSGWRKYNNIQYQFSFEYPEKIFSDVYDELQTSGPSDYLLVQLYITAPGQSLLGEMLRVTVEKSTLNSTAFQVQHSNDNAVNIGSVTGYRKTYSISRQGSDSLHSHSLEVLSNGLLYKIEMTSSNPDFIVRNSDLFDSIVATVKLY